MRVYLFVSYTSWKGGTNNIQVARLCPPGWRMMFIKRFTSTCDRAEQYARRWAKKNNVAIIGDE